ncbi:MAG: hypothetical protein JNM24_00065 [Bdellovibrionaceae bacterium]|nr:hypothetical protein [Pseudobdellovibrionaceae bacterium]
MLTTRNNSEKLKLKIDRKTSISYAVAIAKKFGFISRAFFWDYLTPKPRSTKYYYWDLFLNSKFFIPYREIEESSEFFYLNSKKSNSTNDDIETVSRRSPYYFFHDDKVMRIVHLLTINGLVKNYWTEQELKSNRPLALDLLGGDYTKLPDLVFDLNISNQIFRVALEVEITRKSNERYLRSFLGYSCFRNVDLILFANQQSRITNALKEILSKRLFDDSTRKFGFFDLVDFSQKQLATDLEINSKTIPLGQFFRNLIEIKSTKSISNSSNPLEKSWTTIQNNIEKPGENIGS